MKGLTSPGSEHDATPPPAPRWVKLLGLVAIVIVVVFAILHIAGRGLGGH